MGFELVSEKWFHIANLLDEDVPRGKEFRTNELVVRTDGPSVHLSARDTTLYEERLTYCLVRQQLHCCGWGLEYVPNREPLDRVMRLAVETLFEIKAITREG